jgi:signal transduction histidine kinase
LRFTLTLRLRLLMLWLFTLIVCGALAYVIRDVYQLGSEAQTQKSLQQAEQACFAMQSEYKRSFKPGVIQVDAVLMRALLNLILSELPGIEGGYWHDTQGFVAYAFPTHAGSEEKTDLPSTERGRIEMLVRKSLADAAPATELIAGGRETVVLTACPVYGKDGHLGAWAMGRVPVASGRIYDEVNRGLGLLLAFVVISGAWLGYAFYRWSHHFNRIERELADVSDGSPREIMASGDAELDRIVRALNQYRTRLDAERTRANELGGQLERAERFAALGRMAAMVAHEVRNPIAAMRLKAENALAQPGAEAAALAFVLREIERLDATVRDLLNQAEPVRVYARAVNIADWLAERQAAFAERAVAAEVTLTMRTEVPSWHFDPSALGRALDNLMANALSYAPRGGMIVVSATKNAAGSSLVIRVSDNGPGVAADIEPRLFEPFVSGRADGVGLGLALVREVAVAHGGEARHLRLSSGACFELEIPWRIS